MKKVGYFFFSFLPILAVLGIQFIAVFAVLLPAILVRFANNSLTTGELDTFILNIATDSTFNTVTMVVYSLTTICLFSMWYYSKFEGTFLPIIPKDFNFKMLIAIILAVPGTQFLSEYICELIAFASPDLMKQYEDLINSSGLGDTTSLLMILYSVILAPLCEELIFRGVTFKSIRRIFPFWAANIFQAFLFGAFHANWVQGIYAFAIGLILGYIFEKGGSIYCSILFHVLFNTWGTFASKIITINDEKRFLLVTIPITIITLAAAFVLYRPRSLRIQDN